MGEGDEKKVGVLAIYYVIWCLFGVLANVYSKVFLSDGGDAVTLTMLEYLLGFSVVAIYLCYIQRKSVLSILTECRRDNEEAAGWMFFAVVTNGFGHLLINTSMAVVNVSLTHTIRAAEPLCVLLWDFLLLHRHPNVHALLSLCPIVLGVYLVCRADISFTLSGFSLAMFSNFLFSLRNVCFKSLPKRPDPLIFYGFLCLFGFLLMSLYIVYEFLLNTFSPSSATSSSNLFRLPSPLQLFIAVSSHFIYNTASFGILSSLSTVTHAIGNAMRRVTIVVASIFFFHTEVTMDTFVGIVVSTIGCVGYSLFSIRQSSESTKAEMIKV